MTERTDLPARTETYVGPITDTRIWADFALRDDDIVVSTPPKCGTTWMQTIVSMLIRGPEAAPGDIRDLSPWLDCTFRDTEAQARKLDAETERRCIKSHAPLDGIAYDPRVQYIAVYRHPMDAHFSMRRHVENTHAGFNPPVESRFPAGDDAAGFTMFLDDSADGLGTDRMTLDGLVHHFRTFRRWAHLPNIHLVHYADLSRDLPGHVARLADRLGIQRDADDLTAIAKAADFGAMKAVATAQLAGVEDPVFKDRAAFFDSASSGKRQGRIPESLVDRYRARIAELLPADEVDWLEHGEADRAGAPGATLADSARVT